MAAAIDIPDDLVSSILVRLPVLCLLRFKSVCKSWYALIESSSFVTGHLRHGKENKEHDIITRNNHRNSRDIQDDSRFVLLSRHDSFYQLSAILEYDRQHWCHPTENHLIGCCDGIVCLYNNYSWEVALWNPAMKQLRSLPKSPVHKPYYADGRNLNCDAFGFDVRANDYKVVRVILNTEGEDMPNSQVEVYSLASDSWRVIHEDYLFLPVRFIIRVIKPVFHEGRCLWVGSDQPCCSNLLSHCFLLSFDMTQEVFGTIPLPDPAQENPDSACHLDVFRDQIAFLMYVGDKPLCCEMWVLDQHSWTKLYKIGPVDHIIPVGLLPESVGSPSLLVSAYQTDDDDEEGRMIMYNLATQVQTPLQVACQQCTRLDLYTESLVSIKGGVNCEATTTTI